MWTDAEGIDRYKALEEKLVEAFWHIFPNYTYVDSFQVIDCFVRELSKKDTTNE